MQNKTYIVKNNKHSGYRRAGIVLDKGNNVFTAENITATQLSALDSDPHIEVTEEHTEAQTDSNNKTSGLLASEPLYHSLREAIQSLSADSVDDFTESGKPKTDVLSALMNRPVSAKERDEVLAELSANPIEPAGDK